MPKTLCPEDFHPSEGTIKALIAWGKENQNPLGDRLIDEAFITKESLIIEFREYWLREAPVKDRKKSNWQTTYRNKVKSQWKYELNQYEYNRHKRPDSGSNGFKPFEAMTDQKKPIAPVKPKYRLKTDKERMDDFKKLEEMMK